MRSSHVPVIPRSSVKSEAAKEEREDSEAAKEEREDSGSELPRLPSHSPSSVRYSKREITKDEKEKGGNEGEDSDSEVEEIVYLP